MDAAAAQQAMRRTGAEAAIELLDPDEDAAHLRDRVDAEVRARTVCGASRHVRPRGARSPVRDRELQLRRLGHDRRVGGEGRRDGLGPDARELLVGDGGQKHVSAEAAPLRLGGREHARGETPLHVLRSASVEPPAIQPWNERIAHAGDANRVHVRVQHQRAASARSARDRDDVRAPWPSSVSVVSRPARSHHSATKRASGSSPEPPATTSGLIDSIATSCAASSATSLTYETCSSAIASVSSRIASPSSTSSRVIVSGGTTMITFQCVMR